MNGKTIAQKQKNRGENYGIEKSIWGSDQKGKVKSNFLTKPQTCTNKIS